MSADIDIDLGDRKKILDLIQHTPARLEQDGRPRNHNSGIYVTDIPYDPIHNCASIDYNEAEQRGYFKIDFLNMSVYNLITTPGEYEELLSQEPVWQRLWEDDAWTKQLVHIGDYTELLKVMKPDSITRMAAFISIIRPGKAHLQKQPWDKVFDSVWDGDSSRGFTFKKSHAISYAVLVALHMRILGKTTS